VPVDEPEIRRQLLSGLSLALGGANVIMQLSRPAVGHGVLESTVESGSLHRHPVKRTRTTLGYIMIALYGTDVERAVMRREVDRQHRSVRSNELSPVSYSAFDPQLQLWVAACMFRGLVDAAHFLYGSPDDATLDALYQRSASFATTLQVPASMWPEDRDAFEEYWRSALDQVGVDDATRRFLLGLASLDFLVRPLRWALGPAHRFLTTGFLDQRFRDELGLAWSESQARRFRVVRSVARRMNALAPRVVREFPWNLVLWDTRRRIAAGRPVV
jgi:uncharacterized protein (DUF2236 family)